MRGVVTAYEEKPRARRSTIAAKVSVEDKERLRHWCREIGCTESEYIARAVFGRAMTPEVGLENGRAHLAAAHAVMSAASDSAGLDHVVEQLAAVTRDLLAELRRLR